MPSWDDPGVKWDDPAFGWNGGTTVARVPTWSDTTSTWGDAGEGWNGEVGDIQIAVPPGVYVKDPGVNSNMLQVNIVTQGVPGQPATDIGFYMQVVVPPGHEADQIEYDLIGNFPGPLTVTPAATHGWFSISAGDDGVTWGPTPAWFSTGSVYKRSGNTVWRILGTSEYTLSGRCRIPDREWVDNWHVQGVPTTLNPPLPAGMSRVWSPSWTGTGPRAKDPAGATAKDTSVITQSDRTLWRRSSYPSVTFAYSGLHVTTFTVRSSPVGHSVSGFCFWQQPPNWVLARFGPVPDNTAVTAAMCTVVNNWNGGDLIGATVGSISGWGGNWYMVSGCTLSVEPYSLIGAGTATDPFNWSAQYRARYAP